MLHTVTIDIINDKAFALLKDLERSKLIRLHKEKTDLIAPENLLHKYKGAMSKQPLNEIDIQLNELRSEWE